MVSLFLFKRFGDSLISSYLCSHEEKNYQNKMPMGRIAGGGNNGAGGLQGPQQC